MTKSKIFVNGRSIRQQMIGLNRYTIEVTKRLGDKVQLLLPSGKAKLGRGIIWEQAYLPTRIKKNELLWSPANTGPLLEFNQVVTIHDVIPLEHPEWFTRMYSDWYRFLLPRLVQRVQKIITDSEYSKNKITDLLNVSEDKIIVIPGGVGKEYHPVNSNMLSHVKSMYVESSNYLLVVGTIEPRKNLKRLLRSWQLICNDYRDIQLIIVGVEANSARSVDMPLTVKSTSLLGYVDDQHLPALYSGAIALIFPSVYEGFGLPALEAMACGTPVLASNATSLPEVVGDAGLLFDPYDIDDMSSSIERIITDSDLRETLQLKGLERAKQFTWERTASLVWEVLSQTASDIK